MGTHSPVTLLASMLRAALVAVLAILPQGAAAQGYPSRQIQFVIPFAMPAIRERLLAIGVLATPSTPEEIAQQIRSEQAKWKRVIEVSGAKAE